MNKKLFLAIIIGTAGLIALPWITPDPERINPTEARAENPGSDIALSDGITRYELTGPEIGEPVVLIHGLSSPYAVWDKTAPALAQAGFRVLRYDLFGRGFSDRPKKNYGIELYLRQLTELMEKVGFQERPVRVIAVSMGALIAARFTELFPERVAKLVLFAPAGLPVARIPTLLHAMSALPGLGEWLTRLIGTQFAKSSIQRFFEDKTIIPEFTQIYDRQLAIRGYRYALLSTMRHLPIFSIPAGYELAGKNLIPTALFWGTGDPIAPFENAERVLSMIPQAMLVPIENGSHLCHYDRAKEVNPKLIDFLLNGANGRI